MSAGTGKDQAAPAPTPTGQPAEGPPLPQAVRPHTGRRNAAARDAILDARLLIGHAPLDPHAAQPSRPGEGG
jgi:hypothetical protein